MSVLKFFASSLSAARCGVLEKDAGEKPEALLKAIVHSSLGRTRFLDSVVSTREA